MTRQEGESRLVQLLLRGRPLAQPAADLSLGPRHELLVAELILAQLVRQLGVADSEVVRSQPAYRVLGQLGEQQGGQRAKGEVTELAVKLDSDPRSSVVSVNIVIKPCR